jgi:glutamate-1-semialdehyde 2,1-aminomutase
MAGFQMGVVWLVALAMAGWLCLQVWRRLILSLAKAPGLAGHVRWARRISRWIPARTYTVPQALAIDAAEAGVVTLRQQSWLTLGEQLRLGHEKSLALSESIKPHLPDLQLINRYRVPYPFAELASHLPLTSVWDKSQGNRLVDPDGNAYWDLTGSYGVNLLGTEFYKHSITQAEQMARDLGPVLGSYHPLVQANVAMLREVSGLDQVTFHMSGTEAVMQAVRLARYHTGKPKLVRFAGAYHGWWDDVQPGPGNPMPPSEDTLTLREMHPMTLKVLAQRKDIACVLVNPIQAMHPNRAAPGDSTLMSNGRQSGFDPQAYGRWLHQLREVCSRQGIALILDEVFLGFRMSHRGVQGRYGIQADMVTYGKTLGGGLPVGVVCGQSAWMKRFKEDRPADLCFARGTFNAHPYVMASMNVFLRHWLSPECKALVDGAEALWTQRMQKMNEALQAQGHPIRFAGLPTIWTVIYQRPSRYNWMFQYHLRRHGVALSWVGSGRFIFNFSYTESEFEQVMACVLKAAADMGHGGWWTLPQGTTAATVQRQLIKEMLGSAFQRA